MSAHSLEKETGRYNTTHLEQGIYEFCTSPQVENEYHFLLVCPIYTQIRQTFLTRFCWSFVNINKFKYIMCSNFGRSILNLAKYIFMHSNSEKNFIKHVNLLLTKICYISIILYCIFSDYTMSN